MSNRWVVPVVIFLGLGVAAHASAQGTNFHVLAGASPAGSEDAPGTGATFNAPVGIAINAAGTLYIGDSQNYDIRAVTPAGVVTTFAGAAGEFGGTNGTGTDARFGVTGGAAVDSAGNIYITDTFLHTIRKITPAGVVTTLAGSSSNFGSTDGTGSAARFNNPRGITVDAAGNLFVTDTNNHTIRKVTPAGVVTTVAGLAGTSGNVDGTGSAARFNQPRGIAVDGAGVLYVADSNNQTIRKIAAGGVVTTLAGLAGTVGNTEGTGSAARFNQPRGVALNSAGTTLFVADTNNNRIRQITTAGAVVTAFVGNTVPGGLDGASAGARFNGPEGVVVDAAGNVYIADTISDTIRKATPAGVVTTLAGFYGSAGAVDGTGSVARFAYPFSVAVDPSGNTYVADRTNHIIRKINPSGAVSTLAGLAETPGTTDGTGSAARFSSPQSVAVDSAGMVYVADGPSTIRTITPAGVVTTLAGVPFSNGSVDGTGAAARFNSPRGIAVDNVGNLYVSDNGNHTIRKIAPGGIVTTLAGLAGSSGSTDGAGATARFNRPVGVTVNAAGTIYVADQGNNLIRQITPGGTVTTLAGGAGIFGSTDGTGNAARFGAPQGVAVDGTGTLYVADTGSSTIRKVTAAGVVTTIAGCPGCIGTDNWGRFNMPQGIAVGATGALYVADTRNNTIQTTAKGPAELVIDFGPGVGLWIRRGADEWSQLTPLSAEGFITVHDQGRDILVIDFGPGVGLWAWGRDNGQDFWVQLNAASPTEMVSLDVDHDGNTDYAVFSFPGAGIWVYGGQDNDWFQLHPYEASHIATADLDNDGWEDLVFDFPGNGLWVYSTGKDTWSQLHTLDVSRLLSADLDGNGTKALIVDFPGRGIWTYRGTTGWAIIHPYDVKGLATGDVDGNGMADLVIDFGPGVGVWLLQNGTTWSLLNGLTTEGITTGDTDGNGHDEIIFDFGAAGIWSYEDIGGWKQVHPVNPKTIGTGRFF